MIHNTQPYHATSGIYPGQSARVPWNKLFQMLVTSQCESPTCLRLGPDWMALQKYIRATMPRHTTNSSHSQSLLGFVVAQFCRKRQKISPGLIAITSNFRGCLTPPTRWTVCAVSLQSVLDNYEVALKTPHMLKLPRFASYPTTEYFTWL